MPPFGILDIGKQENIHIGCRELRKRVDKMKPKIHIFGHIHESYGTQKLNNTLFINAAQCGAKRKLVNSPVIVSYKHAPK